MLRTFIILLGLMAGLPVDANQCDRVFDFHYTVSYQMVPGQNETQTLRMEADLYLRKLEADESGQWWGIALAEPVSFIDGERVVTQAIYTTPFAVKLSKSGLILNFWFPYPLNNEQKDKLTSFVYALQFQRTDKTVLEKDQFGEYKANYWAGKNGGDWHKQKTDYLEDQFSELDIKGIEVVASKNTAHADECWFRSVHGKEKLLIMPNEKLRLITDVEHDIRWNPNKAKKGVFWSLPTRLSQWQLEKPLALNSALLDALRPANDIEQKALEKDLISHLNLLTSDLKDLNPIELTELFRRFEFALPVIKKFLLDESVSPQVKEKAIFILGLLDSPTSQNVLSEIIQDDRFEEDSRYQSVINLTTHGENELTEASLGVLSNLIDKTVIFDDPDMQMSALFLTGAVVRFRKDTQGAEELRKKLKEELSLAHGEQAKAAILVTIGNTHDPKLLDAIKMHTNSPSNLIRSKAAKALSFVRMPEAKEELQGMLHVEQHPKVQKSIIKAMSNYQLDTPAFDALGALAQASNDRTTRYHAIRAIGAQTEKRAAAENVLKQMLETEKNDLNYKEIMRQLTLLKQN